MLAAAGAPAIGTTSFGVALNHGVWDGEQLPLDEALAVATAIVDAVEVPVSVDMEAGRGRSPAEVQQSVAAVIASGAVGINIEDSIPGRQAPSSTSSEQAERIAAARAAAEASGIPIFVNARCDVFFGADIEPDQRVEEVLLRSKSYQMAGADGLFLPGLLDVPTITVADGAGGAAGQHHGRHRRAAAVRARRRRRPPPVPGRRAVPGHGG